LAQGAPSSPLAANLAGLWLDRAIVSAAARQFAPGKFAYSRYADDLVLSAVDCEEPTRFAEEAAQILARSVAGQGWTIQSSKSRQWTTADSVALHVCGLRVPTRPGEPLTLGRETWRRARSALHRLRHRSDFGLHAAGSPAVAHGLLAYSYSATGDLRWLAYTSARLAYLARRLGGPIFSESLLAGWSDESSLADVP